MADSRPSRERRPTVLLIADAAPAQGGIPRFVELVMNDPELRASYRLDLLNTTRAGVREAGGFTWKNSQRALADSIRAFRMARTVDVVHIQTALMPTGPLLRAAALCLAARRAGASVLCHAHTGLINDGSFRPTRVQRAVLRSVARNSRLIAVSEAGRAGLAKFAGGAEVYVVHNAIDPERVEVSGLAGEPPRISYVGTLTRAKGLLELRDALVSLRRQGLTGWRLELIGGGAHAGEGEAALVRLQFEKAGLGDGIRGHVDPAEVAAHLAQADLFVLPSHSEGQPIAVLEAMAAGLPCIVTNVGAMPDLVRHGVDGIVIPPHDSEALAAACRRLLESRELRRRMGASARERVLGRFTLVQLRAALDRLYSPPAEPAPPAPPHSTERVPFRPQLRTRAARLPEPEPRALLLVVACLLAAGVGLCTAIDPVLGIGLAIAVLVVPATIWKPRLAGPLLVVAIYGESVHAGALSIGRFAAPLAGLALGVHVLVSIDLPRAGRGVVRWAFGFVLLAMASLLWSASPSGTMSALVALVSALVYMGVFSMTLREPEHFNAVLWTVALCAFLLGAWWIVSFSSGVDRFSNPAGDPNFAASYLAASIPLVLAFGSSRARALDRVVLYFVLIVITGSVLATLSRGGFLTLLVVAGLIVVAPTKLFFRSMGHKLAVLLAVTAGLVLIVPATWAKINERFQGEQSRVGIWEAAWHGYASHPVLGIGYGAFPDVSYELMATTPGVDLSAHTPEALEQGRFVHNTYLETLVELGAVGLAVFAALLTAVYVALTRALMAPGHSDPLKGLAAAVLVALTSFLFSSFFLSAGGRRMLWLLFGMTVALADLTRRSGDARALQTAP